MSILTLFCFAPQFLSLNIKSNPCIYTNLDTSFTLGDRIYYILPNPLKQPAHPEQDQAILSTKTSGGKSKEQRNLYNQNSQKA
jgi:hypothetical protein